MAQEALHATLENEIRALADELRGKQKTEMTPGEAREAIKSALGERIQRVDIEGSSAPVAPTTPAPAPAPNPALGQPSAILPSYASSLPREQQLRAEQLLDVALHQGIAPAIAAAKQESPIILDVLHDALAGKLYDILKERNLL